MAEFEESLCAAMGGCWICWERAQQDVQLLGGSVVDHYRRRLDEIDNDLGSVLDKEHLQLDGGDGG